MQTSSGKLKSSLVHVSGVGDQFLLIQLAASSLAPGLHRLLGHLNHDIGFLNNAYYRGQIRIRVATLLPLSDFIELDVMLRLIGWESKLTLTSRFLGSSLMWPTGKCQVPGSCLEAARLADAAARSALVCFSVGAERAACA